jgi:hypothetical protein
MSARPREAVRRAEAVADQVEAAVRRWWRELLSLFRRASELGLPRFHQAVTLHWLALPVLTRDALVDGLVGVYQWGAGRAAAQVPVRVLRRVLSRRRVPALAAAGAGVALREDRRRPTDPIDALFFDPGRVPDDLLRRLVLPVPPEPVIRRRIDRLVAPFLATPRPDLADPRRHAARLTAAYAQGKSVDEIAEELLPVAEGVRASARRVARTWSMHVANESQWEAQERLGPDVVVGYKVVSALTEDTRPWHRERHGQVYLRNPGPGEKGFFQLPRPPREPDDPKERPLGAPWLAWNCL